MSQLLAETETNFSSNQEDVGGFLILLPLIWLTVLLFYDDIYPSQLTGPDKDGDEITLNVCPPALNEDTFSLENVPANPPLNPCFYYLGVRGFDRLVSLFRLTFEGRQRASKEYCGTSGGFRFCYTMCVALRPGAATTTATDLACIIYNNGYPPKPALLPSDIEAIPLAFLPTAANVNDNFFCGTITTSTNEVRCLEPCTEIAPITTNPAPAFCYCEIEGSVNDILGSLFYATIGVIDRQVEDRIFCTYKSYTEEGLRCSDSRRLCRPDSRGVFLLPPGQLSCLMYLNGPAGAVGLLSATFWAGVSTLAPTVTGLTVAGSSTAITCSPPLYCNAGNGCCLVTFTNRGLICPDIC